ncbi:MAG: hypothetical protein WAW26_13520, partial [Anaerolineae bacterium]
MITHPDSLYNRIATRRPQAAAWAAVILAAIAWILAYRSLQPLANWLAFDLIGLTPGSHLGEAVAFFLY